MFIGVGTAELYLRGTSWRKMAGIVPNEGPLSSVLMDVPSLMNRLLLTCLVLASALFASAQPTGSSESLDPRMVPPQATVVVRKHPMSADMVEITVLDPGYPAELLGQQVARLCETTGAPARGLSITRNSLGNGPNLVFLKATFATNNLVDVPSDSVNLQAIVRALVGGPPEHAIRSLLVSFPEGPLTANPLKSFRTNAVVLSGESVASPPELEYRIVALTQDPERIVIPVRYDAPKAESAAGGGRRSRLPVLLALVGVAGIGVGALVYLALQKGLQRH